ncbi:7224_t:CDS:2 [Cetraspora pellucida]|uniref:7224_t:CDS:1 n=1 Tax=Cetraspora pellucida TaxID=1433469 RepID=A0A9N9HMG1_9GLOM|nr:7224_t:CDS:2 [Cetraspora pellucida]
MNTSKNPRFNRQKGLPAIPFQYHEAYDDRYRTAGRDTYIVNDEYIDNEQSEIPSIPERDTYLNTDEPSDNDVDYEEYNPESPISSPNNDHPSSPPPSPKKYDRSVSDPISINEKSQSLLSSLPTLAPSSPISHQLPAEYFPDNFDKDEKTKPVEQSTQELTIDDLYHFVLNIRKGFQSQFNEMNSQIKELKKEIRRLKGEESEDEDPNDDVKDVTNVRSATRQMERYGGAGRW